MVKKLKERAFVLVEPLQLRLDLLPSRQESTDGRNKEADAFPERHLPPNAAQDGPRVLVDEGNFAPDFLGRARRRDHLVADLDAVLSRDSHLELGEEGQRGNPAGPRHSAHEGLVPDRVKLEGDDPWPPRDDLAPDRAADVEDVPNAQEGDHSRIRRTRVP